MVIVLALLRAVLGAFLAAFLPKASLVLENLALRHQLAVLRRATPRPRLRPVDRAFWVALSRSWSRWTDVLAIVKPATVVAWHRRGFARFWAKKSRPIGRPPLADEVVALIRRMAAENPLWSRRRIAAELAKLGYKVSKDTVAKYMPRCPRHSGPPRSLTWGTFLRMHLPGTLAIDFLTVPTVTFNVLYVFFVLSLDRRRILHINVTAHPYAEWAAQQVVEAVGFDTSISHLIRDRDGIYGARFDARVNNDAPTGDGTLWPAARAADSPLPVLTGCLGACASSLRRHFVARNMLPQAGEMHPARPRAASVRPCCRARPP